MTGSSWNWCLEGCSSARAIGRSVRARWGKEMVTALESGGKVCSETYRSRIGGSALVVTTFTRTGGSCPGIDFSFHLHSFHKSLTVYDMLHILLYSFLIDIPWSPLTDSNGLPLFAVHYPPHYSRGCFFLFLSILFSGGANTLYHYRFFVH